VSTFHADNAAKDVDVRLKDGVTTVYIGSCYDKDGNTTRTYYYHNGQPLAALKTWRVAVRENGTPYWQLTDRLGSTAVVVDASGTVIGERR
jgi:lysozyme family protein